VNVNLTKVIYAAEMSNMANMWLSGVFFQALNTPKFVFSWGSAPDPAGGAYDAPLDPLVGWGGAHPRMSISLESKLIDILSYSSSPLQNLGNAVNGPVISKALEIAMFQVL